MTASKPTTSKRGRPPRKNANSSKAVRTYLTPEEMDEFERAMQPGQSVADFARRAILAEARRINSEDKDQDQLPEGRKGDA